MHGAQAPRLHPSNAKGEGVGGGGAAAYRETKLSPLPGPLTPGEGCQHVMLQPVVDGNLDQVGVGDDCTLTPSQLPCSESTVRIGALELLSG